MTFYLLIFICLKKNGIETALEIKKQNYEINIFLITANTRPQIMEQCFESGFIDFISKPISIDQLMKSIQSIESTGFSSINRSLFTKTTTDIKLSQALIDKIFISQLRSDLGNDKFVEVIQVCILSLKEIKKLLEKNDNKKKILELLHKLT